MTPNEIIEKVLKETEEGILGEIDYEWDGKKVIRDNIVFKRSDYIKAIQKALSLCRQKQDDLIENYKTALVLSNEHIEELEKEQDENVKKLKEELINYHVDKGEWYKYYIRAKDVFEIIDSIFKDNHNQHTKPVDLQSDELSEAHKDISFRSEMDKTADAEPSDEHRALVTRDDAVSRIDDGSPNILEEFEINLNKIQEKYLGIMQKEMEKLRKEYCKNYSQQTNPTNSERFDVLPEPKKSNGKQDKVKTADVIIINATPETMAQYYLEQDEKGEEEK